MPRRVRHTIGIALAGGGPLGAIYEIGALVALQDALQGLDLAKCGINVGVSAGGVIAAGLANGYTPRDMHAMFIESEHATVAFDPDMLVRPALSEYARRLAALPRLIRDSALGYFDSARERGFFESFQRIARSVPTGVFDNVGFARVLERILSASGRTNDFRELGRKLFVVATDLDSARAVTFGAPGWDHVPISRAVQASAALPGLFPPVEIDGRHYVDGALVKTLHASVALKEGAELLICVNPLVPFNADLARDEGHPDPYSLVDYGLPAVMSQTFRAIIHSRMKTGMDRYRTEFPDADVVLFEPARGDAEMFFTNIFSYSGRKRLAEHAYRRTLLDLRRRAETLAPIFARHGISLDDELIHARNPGISSAGAAPARQRALSETAAELDQTLERLSALLKVRTGTAA